MAEPPPPLLTEAEIYERLAVRFAQPEYVCLPHLRGATGALWQGRTLDAMAMSLWPSRGLFLHGFEIKSHRGDWLSELRNPAKADTLFGYFDYWWLVTGHDKIATLDEVPEVWGLLTVKGDKLYTVRQAPKLVPSHAITRSFLADVLRQATFGVSKKLLAKEYTRGRQDGKQEREYRHEQAITALKTFQDASGVDLLTKPWEAGEIGAAVKVITEGGLAHLLPRLQTIIATLKRHAAELETVLADPTLHP